VTAAAAAEVFRNVLRDVKLIGRFSFGAC